MFKRVTYCTLWILLLVSAQAQAQTERGLSLVIGKVVYSKGVVTVTREQADKTYHSVALKRRDELYQGDQIATGVDGKFSAKLIDGSVITLGNSSDFNINEYSYSESSQVGHALFETTKGAFRAVTGAIQKQKKSSYQVKTPLAVIGVRGTDFWGGFIFGDQLDVTVLSGKGVYVESDEGRVLLNVEEGTTVIANQRKPTQPKVWPKEKLNKAVASVTLD